uniref:uncharacterized protein LOC122596918 n=1 Tax=Erigeron canadensis TaxID=72917 RepID=UPI001CB9581A|nr:uncharacterized protein LOC122596918 [Erigeron canadensis]
MTTNKITLVEQLDASKDFINMKVKIIRRWINQIQRLEMVLVDEKGAKIQCTVKKDLVPMFDELIKEDADVIIKRFGVGKNDDPFPEIQFNAFLEQNKSEEHVIAIMQHALINEWKENLTVKTDKFGTRIFINEDIQEANDFRRRLILKEGVNEVSHTTLASQTVYPNRLEFILNTDKKQLDEVRDSEETGDFVVVATIVMLEQEFGWFFIGCRKDGKKVITKTEYLEVADENELTDELISAPADSLWYRKKAIATEVVPKFRVTMRVQDSTDSASFVMWDRDVQKLLGLSANDIRQRQLNNKYDESYPRELEGLLNVKVACKIKIDKYNLKHKGSTYTIIKMCDDPDIIAELEELAEPENNNEVQGEPAMPEVAIVKLGEESQGTPDSKDAFSVTGDSLATEIEKDSETSPLQKRANETPGVESTNKVGKRMRRPKIY